MKVKIFISIILMASMFCACGKDVYKRQDIRRIKSTKI